MLVPLVPLMVETVVAVDQVVLMAINLVLIVVVVVEIMVQDLVEQMIHQVVSVELLDQVQ